MIRAYSVLYLDDAIRSLSAAFDYAINDCKIEADVFADLFAWSEEASLFEHGSPWIVSGRSGVELVRKISERQKRRKRLPKPSYSAELSKEYWAGWALAQYQWYSAKRFRDIFSHVPLSEIISMYPLFHERDIYRFYESMDRRYHREVRETNLQKLRKRNNRSQRKLSKMAGVNIRSIQLYEQRVNDIDKAQAHTLYKLAWALNCKIEDLLEEPEIMK